MNHHLEVSATMVDETVGLTAERPFRFCTMRFGASAPEYVLPGDDPTPPLEADSLLTWHAIEVSMPETPTRTHIQPHNHTFYELAIIRDGSVRHVCTQGEETFGRGDVIVVTPRGVHGFEGANGLVQSNIYVRPDWLCEDLRLLWNATGLIRFLLADALFRQRFHDGVLHFRLTEPELKMCERELEDIHKEALNPQPSLVLFNAAFLKLLWLLNKAYVRDEGETAFPLRREVWNAVQSIEQIVRQARPFELSELAKNSGLSRSGFAQLFKDTTGLSPMNYYQQRRVLVGAERLQKPELSVTEIAFELGFSDSSHFSRVFKKAMGLSPAAYREGLAQRQPDGIR